METDAVRVIRAVTNTPVEIPEEKEEVNMCKAIEDMMEDSRQEGARKGKQVSSCNAANSSAETEPVKRPCAV